MAESALDRQVARELDRRGAWSLKTHGAGAGRRGIPDFLVCYRGAFIAIEDKQPAGRVDPLQRYELERIRRAGGHAIVARTIDDVRQALDVLDAHPLAAA